MPRKKPSLIHRAIGLQWQQAVVGLKIIPVSLMNESGAWVGAERLIRQTGAIKIVTPG